MSGAFVIVGVHPADVSAVLKLDPDRAWVAGERNTVTLRNGQTLEFSSICNQSGWKKFSPDELIEPDEIIRYWVEFVQEQTPALRQLPVEASVSIDVLVQDKGALDLSPHTLATLGNARVGLCLTVQVMAGG